MLYLDYTFGGSVNPARAGMIPWFIRNHEGADRKPRASGDDPALALAHVYDPG